MYMIARCSSSYCTRLSPLLGNKFARDRPCGRGLGDPLSFRQTSSAHFHSRTPRNLLVRRSEQRCSQYVLSFIL